MKNLKTILLCVASAMLLLYAALYNGYPLYDGDTHAYLSTGFSDVWPADRPVFYGMFLRVTSGWASLWFSAFAQALLVACLLLRYISLVYGGPAGGRFKLTAVMVITAGTGIAWVCSYLMPDVFGAVLLLSVLLYLFDDRATLWLRALYLAAIALATLVHNAHFLVVFAFCAVVLIYALFRRYRLWWRRAAAIMVVSVCCYLAMCLANFEHGKGFVFSPSARVFTMAKLASTGILKQYLDDNCGKKNLKLCSCKEQLSPYPWDFMWPAPGTALDKIHVWDSCDQEFSAIIHDVLTTPKYMSLYATKSVVFTGRQLFEVGVLQPTFSSPDPLAATTIKRYFGEEYNEFMVCRQNAHLLDTQMVNLVSYLFFVISSVWVLLFYCRATSRRVFFLYSAIMLFFIINAFITSTFSMVHARYQYKIFWLLPATNAILMLQYLQGRYRGRLVADGVQD